MQNAPFEDIVGSLTLGQTPRVWSLVISVFGDLAQEDGAQISGQFLRQLTHMIGIKPEAMRVALHRLRKEGWIESQRQGRNSVYFLTPKGYAQTVEATPRIYAAGPAAPQAWLAVFNPLQPPENADRPGAWLSAHMLITPQVPDQSDAYVTRLTPETAIPDWMTDKLCSPALRQLAEEFAQVLEQVRGQLSTPLTPMEVAVLRVLVVHGWRRIVLKAPILPDYVFPNEWAGARCRAQVTALLAKHSRPPLDELEAAAASG
jgi:phenylacetic acid degradation operon negative regulatory protein